MVLGEFNNGWEDNHKRQRKQGLSQNGTYGLCVGFLRARRLGHLPIASESIYQARRLRFTLPRSFRKLCGCRHEADPFERL
jgi:hypothetical protein